MNQCILCEGFVPPHATICPNCSNVSKAKSKAYSQLRTAANVVGAGIVSMTLMACYGAPPSEDFMPHPEDSDYTKNPYPEDSDYTKNPSNKDPKTKHEEDAQRKPLEH